MNTQGPPQRLTCPDCGKNIPTERFIQHRETEHPPVPITVAAGGIQSETRFGTDLPQRGEYNG